MEPITTLDVGPAPVSSITVSGNRVAWTAGDAGGSVPHKVVLFEDGVTEELARTSYPNGYVPHVRLGARWAVYADLSSAEPTGVGEPQEPWRVEAVALDTGERVLVTEQSPSTRESSPAPRIEDDTVVWSTRVGDSGESDVFAFDLSTRTKRTLVRATIGNTAVGGGKVYYDRYTDSGSDIFSVALDGSGSTKPAPQPQQVSRSGQASKPAASRFGVAWVEPPQGNSTTIVVVRDGGSPEVLASASGPNDPVGYNPQVCDGFAIWDPLAGLSARALGDRGRRRAPVLLEPQQTLSSEARWSCDGATVAWVSFKNPVGTVSGVVVNVARVRTAASR